MRLPSADVLMVDLDRKAALVFTGSVAWQEEQGLSLVLYFFTGSPGCVECVTQPSRLNIRMWSTPFFSAITLIVA
jgi:hypothetical protein